MQQRFEYKVPHVPYKTPQSGKPSYLDSLLNFQSNRTTRSSYIITLQCASVRSCFERNNISFNYHGLYFEKVVPNNINLTVFHLIVIIKISFILTSFINASFCE